MTRRSTPRATGRRSRGRPAASRGQQPPVHRDLGQPAAARSARWPRSAAAVLWIGELVEAVGSSIPSMKPRSARHGRVARRRGRAPLPRPGSRTGRRPADPEPGSTVWPEQVEQVVAIELRDALTREPRRGTAARPSSAAWGSTAGVPLEGLGELRRSPPECRGPPAAARRHWPSAVVVPPGGTTQHRRLGVCDGRARRRGRPCRFGDRPAARASSPLSRLGDRLRGSGGRSSASKPAGHDGGEHRSPLRADSAGGRDLEHAALRREPRTEAGCPRSGGARRASAGRPPIGCIGHPFYCSHSPPGDCRAGIRNHAPRRRSRPGCQP